MLRSVERRGLMRGTVELLHRCFSSARASGDGRRLEGKVALITGGASGLGLATAREFIRQGAKVLIADVNSQLGSNAAKELGPDAHFTPCDVTVEQQVSDAVDLAVSRHGKLDILHNSAGIVGPSVPPSIADLDLSEFDRVMTINVRGTVTGIKHAARVMAPAGSGSILCTASICGVMAGVAPHPYTISKFSITGVVKSAASELCGRGVRVNCISPSAVATPLVVQQLAAYYPGVGKEVIEDIVHGSGVLKGAKCEEMDVANAAVYLASDDAKYVAGHNLVVDGGFTCFKNFSFPVPQKMVHGSDQ